MQRSNYKLGVGLVAVASTIICVFLVSYFYRVGNPFIERYRVTVNFQPSFLVQKDMNVWKSGVQIGRVAYVKLLPDDQGVDLVLELDRGATITQGETCRVISRSSSSRELAVEFIQPTKSILISRFDGAAGAAKNNELDPNEYEFARNAMNDGDYVSGGIVAIDSPNLFDTSVR